MLPKMGTSISSTSTTLTSSSSTSSPLHSWCRHFYGAVPMSQEKFDVGPLEADACFTPSGRSSDLSSCPSMELCSVAMTERSDGAVGSCESCAMLVLEAWPGSRRLRGELRWAAFGNEALGYKVSLMDQCGALQLVATVEADESKADLVVECCSDLWYFLEIDMDIPEETVALGLHTWEGSHGQVIPLLEGTYSTVTSTVTSSVTSSVTRSSTASTTSTSTEVPIVEALGGCLGLSTPSAEVFTANPAEAQEAVRQAISDATGAENSWVEVVGPIEAACGASGGETRRRLQQELSFNWVIRWPPAAPVAVAAQSLAQQTAQLLAEMPVEQVTNLVVGRLAEQEVFDGLQVNVVSLLAEVLDEDANTTAAFSDPPQAQGSEGMASMTWMAMGMAAFTFICFCALFVQHRIRQKLEVRRAYLVTKKAEVQEPLQVLDFSRLCLPADEGDAMKDRRCRRAGEENGRVG
eukprot:s3938_g5.t1